MFQCNKHYLIMPKKQVHYFPSCVVKVYKGVPVSNSQYSHLQNMDPKDFQKVLTKYLQSSKK